MADFEYNPVAGWEDETIFPDYPTAQEVRPLFQRLFNQIRDAFNLTKNDYETHKAETTTTETQPHGLPKNKLDATTAPTVNDDSGDGYSVNSVWIDTVTDKAYVCLDATVGAAVWKEITASGVGSGSLILLAAKATISNAAMAEITIPNTYGKIVVFASSFRPASAGAVLQAQISADGGATYLSGATDYKYCMQFDTAVTADNTYVSDNSDGDTKIVLSPALVASGAYRTNIKLTFTAPFSGAAYKPMIEVEGSCLNSANKLAKINGVVALEQTVNIDKIKLYMSTGNITQGYITVFGIKEV
jgi:hypothetical protein